MKTSFSLAFGLGLALAAPLMVGCAGEEAEGEGANYPEPIGYDAPGAPLPPGQVAASSSAQAPQGIPAAPPSPLPAPDPGVEGAQDDANDVAVGGSDGSDYADTDPSALTDFRSTLDPYGTWVDDPTYGTVWQPSPSVVGSDFSPYVTGGSWTYDDSGDYVWASDYDWGWAPFHYGRWAYLGTGWGWIPGRTYAGAWVSWREGGGYLGWAPLPPTWYWRSGYAFGLGVVPYAPYSFCGYHNVFQPHFGGGLVAGGAVVGVAAGTHPYVPAHPTVGGAGGGANGTAGGGRVAAHPTVGGPSPSSLGLQPREVARASGQSSAGIAHAQAFAHPNTAQALGAHAPAVNAISASNGYASRGMAANQASASRMPAYGRANTVVASAPRYNGVSPAPYHSPSYSVPRGSYGGSTYGGSSYNGSRAYGSAPSYGSPHASSPYYGGGSHYGAPSYAGGAYRGVGGTHPSSSSSSSSSQSEPAYGAPHHSSGGGGYRGGGGFHGGGGGGHAGGGHR